MSAENFRVAVHSDDYFPNIGGVATHVHEVTSALLDCGTTAGILTSKPAANSKRGFSFRKEPGPPPVVRLPKQPPILARYFASACRRATASLVARDSQDSRPIICHSHWYQPWWADRHWAHVFTNHTSMFLQGVGLGRAEKWRRRLSVFDAFIAPSSELAQGTIDLGVPADRVHYIPNGVDGTKFKPDQQARKAGRHKLAIADDAIVVLSARRIVPKNGVIDFTHSLRYLEQILSPERCERVVIAIAGNEEQLPSDYQDETIQSLTQSTLGRKTMLLGAVPNHEMPELFAAADISVLPSLKEATSIAGLEAMASGVPLVGTKVGGIPDLIADQEDGLLVDHGNPVELAAALAKLIDGDDMRQTMSQRARNKALEQFSWRTIAQQTIEVYEQALQLAAARSGIA